MFYVNIVNCVCMNYVCCTVLTGTLLGLFVKLLEYQHVANWRVSIYLLIISVKMHKNKAWLSLCIHCCRVSVISYFGWLVIVLLPVWSGHLEQSTTGHSFSTYIINVQKHAQDTSFLTFLLH